MHVAFMSVLIFCALIPCLALTETVARYRACAARRHVKAEQKALSLLKEWLSPAQRAQYERDGHFEVNIDEFSEHGALVAVWCFGPHGYLPVGDVMLAQKIALETNETAALQVANSNH